MKNKIALVTGATSGIGAATASLLRSKGATVILTGRDQQRGARLVKELDAGDGDVLFLQADMARAADITELFNEIKRRFGRLDLACNCAGTDNGATGALTGDLSEEAFDLQMATNLKGVWLCTKHEINIMLQRGKGSIVNISSINGLGGTVGAAAYSMAKHGVIGLTKTAALEYAEKGIRVNVVCPGMIDTPMLGRVLEGISPGDPDPVRAHLTGHIPLRRFGQAAEVAEAAAWLLSDAASFVTGHTLVIDGGMTCQFR